LDADLDRTGRACRGSDAPLTGKDENVTNASTQIDLPVAPPVKPRVVARTQVLLSLLVGVLAALPVAGGKLSLYPLVAWDIACLVYLTWVWRTIWGRDAEETAGLAVYEDPTRATADLVALTAALVSLVAVGFVLGQASSSKGSAKVLLALLGVASIALSWAVVHTVHTLRYARLYYTGVDGGVDFNEDDPPCYVDFAYLAFTIGMTFQVSDTAITTKEIRKTALLHAWLSYLFGAGILATTINLIANL
jgi:uncharacterized membrane protein